MVLYIVRHAWAEERSPLLFPDDSLRPLTKKGQIRFNSVAKKLRRCGVAPDVIATSPYTRCRQTAEILARRLSDNLQAEDVNALAPGGSLAKILAWTNRQERAGWNPLSSESPRSLSLYDYVLPRAHRVTTAECIQPERVCGRTGQIT